VFLEFLSYGRPANKTQRTLVNFLNPWRREGATYSTLCRCGRWKKTQLSWILRPGITRIERARQTFKIQATHFRDVLAGLAVAFVIFQERVGSSVLFLQATHMSPEPHADQGIAFGTCSILLPRRQRSFATIQQSLIFRTIPDAGRDCG
jgi:hypothetical protein